MSFDITCWTRLSADGTAIYLRPDAPDWFVPTAAGDAALLAARANTPLTGEQTFFLDRLPETAPTPYAGRRASLPLTHLRELWLHVTDRCNLACRHCLFCSGPSATRELPVATALARIAEARELGCRLVALTGGEPFCHPDMPAIIEGILADPEAHAVILTNGTAFSTHADWLSRQPRQRLHFQVSCDGLAPRHDALRGDGAFARLLKDLTVLRRLGYAFTLSFCPTTQNIGDLPDIVELAAQCGAANLHLMWHFAAGRGQDAGRPTTDVLFAAVTAAVARAEAAGLTIDNLDALRTQVFAPVGTRHDGASAGYESLAIGPDDRLYPSPALIGIPELATSLAAGLETAWRASDALDSLRAATCAGSTSPWRFILGGGDPDHSYRHSGVFTGADPYQPLFERLAAWTICREAAATPPRHPDRPGLTLKMGETHASCHAHGEVALAHTNCLLALAGNTSLDFIKAYYTEAATKEKNEILNPACYPLEMMDHIPERYRVRGYGCGSPIADAGLTPGETVVDLGCGAGVECLIAARRVGPAGRAIGVDMLPAMLRRATAAARGTADVLGYANAAFFQGYLEALPLGDAIADCITSNCVLNLSTRKRRLYAEIFRVLKPGGRLVFSDVATETPASAAICNDPALRGECISGTLTQKDLVAILEESGFTAIRILRRFPYRVVRRHPFYSITVEARRPLAVPKRRKVLYRGPFRAILTAGGDWLRAGEVREIALSEEDPAAEALFFLDDAGNIINPGFTVGESACCCASTAPGAVAALLEKFPEQEALTPLRPNLPGKTPPR